MISLKKAICITLASVMSFCVLGGCSLWGDPANPSKTTSEPTPYNPYKEEETELEKRVSELPLPEDADVFYLVAATGEGSECRFYSFEKNGERWMNLWDTEGYVGKNGVNPGERKINDYTTPKGLFHMGGAFGIGKTPDQMNVDFHNITDDDYWDGDVNSDTFNTMVKGSEKGADWDKAASEHLVDYEKQYQYCVDIGFNNEPVDPEAGFAIFLHCTGDNPYTGGCVAIPKGYMIKVMRQLTENSYIAIVNNLDELEAVVY